jgi:hypothetical protein
MKKRKVWSAAEVATLKLLYLGTSTATVAKMLKHPVESVYRKAHVLGLRKSAEYLAGPEACRLRRGDNIGAAHRFRPGHVPANKGLRRPGWAPGRMAQTQFKKGQMAGAAQKKWVPVGTEVRDDEGYLKRKISDDRTIPSRFNWRYVHVLLWAEHYGPIPPGYVVKFIDGDKKHIALDNLALLSRSDLMGLNTYHNYPKEIAELIQLRGALVRKINTRIKHAKHD